MAPNQYGGQSNIADNITNIPYRTKSYKLMTEKAQDNTYIHIRAKTPIKSNLIYMFWFTENSETVLKDVIYGKPKQIRPTAQSYIKVNFQVIMIKTKTMSKNNMAETNRAEIPIWREIQHGWHSAKQRKYWQFRISAYINHSAVISSSSN